jgi:membrane-associated phospholipid phosphatase
MDKLHFFELPFVEFIQSFRTPLLDKFFLFLNFLDSDYFIMILIPIIWLGYSWKWGARLFYIIVLSGFFNHLVKVTLMQPRPFQIDPSLFVINLKYYGFPSYAAQTSVIYAGIIIRYFKRKWLAWIFGINIVFWMCLSRIYLGVHFPSDILGGIIFGFLFLLVFYFLFPKVENFIKKKKLVTIFLLSQILPIPMLLFLLNNRNGELMTIAAMAIGLGLVLSKKFDAFLEKPKNFLEGFLRVFFAFLGMGVILGFSFVFFLNKVFLIQYITMALWISFFLPLIWKKKFLNLKIFSKR